MEKFKVVIAGAGIIGAGIGVNSAVAGFPTVMLGFTPSRVPQTQQRVKGMLDTLVENKVITAAELDEINARIEYTCDLPSACTGAGYIVEAGTENVQKKQELYAEIEKYVGKDVIIGSCTTALMPTELQKLATYPERILVTHPYNPSYLLPLIELCAGEKTSDYAMEHSKEFFTAIGKVPLVCHKEISGYIVNRVNWAVGAEAEKTVDAGIASVEDMDKAIIYGPGLRMAITGQLLTLSLGVGKEGYLGMAAKYGSAPKPYAEKIAAGIDAAMANRPVEQGQDYDAICKWRDKMIIEYLRLLGAM